MKKEGVTAKEVADYLLLKWLERLEERDKTKKEKPRR